MAGGLQLHSFRASSASLHGEKAAEQHSSLTSIIMQLLLVHGNDVCAHAILHRKWHSCQQLQRVAHTSEGA